MELLAEYLLVIDLAVRRPDGVNQLAIDGLLVFRELIQEHRPRTSPATEVRSFPLTVDQRLGATTKDLVALGSAL